MSNITISNATIRIGATAEDVAKGTSAAIGHMRQFAAEAAAVLGGVKLTMFAYHANDDIEKAQLAFEVMLKSADKAKNLMSGLFRFERDTPARITELTSAMRQLLTAGFELADAPAMLRILGDAAASTGQNFEESIKRITASLAGAQARGWFTGEEIRELQRQVIPAVRYLAEGMSKEMGRAVSEGEIVKMYEDKLISTSKSVRFILTGLERDRKGMMTRLANETYSGIFSTMVSQAEIFAHKFMRGFDSVMHVKEGLAGVRDYLVEIAAGGEAVGASFAKSDWFQVPYRTAQALFELLKLIRDTARFAFGDIGSSLSEMKDFPQQAREIWMTFFGILAEGFYRIKDAIATAFVIPLKTSLLIIGNIGDFFDRHLIPGDSPERQASRENWAKTKAGLEQEIRDRAFGNALENDLAGIEKWKAAMRDAPKMDALKDTGLHSIMEGAVGAAKSLDAFNKAAKDLKLPEKEWDDHKMRDFFKDVGRDMEKHGLTPLQKLKKELSDLEDIFAMGFIDENQFLSEQGSVLLKANKGADRKSDTEPRVAEAIRAGSVEARRIQIAAMMGQSEKSVPDLLTKLNAEGQKQTRELQEIRRQLAAEGAIFVP